MMLCSKAVNYVEFEMGSIVFSILPIFSLHIAFVCIYTSEHISYSKLNVVK